MMSGGLKIGILTYHQAENFGAVMQAYALQQYLMSQGHSVQIIDYRCFAISVHYQIWNPSILFSRKNIFKSFKEYIERFNSLNARVLRKRAFKDFCSKYILLSKAYYRITEPLPYDVIIVGSDQVWNFHLNKGSENIYLLDFPLYSKTKKIAYAASSEENGLNRISDEKLKMCLSSFSKISVRERFLQEKMIALVNEKVFLCLDPTFLLPQKAYLSIANYRYCEDKKYILVYHMTPMLDYISLIKQVAEKNDCEIVELYGGYNRNDSKNIIENWGPCDVLGLIAGADQIFTTSFHGLALSLIMKKEVWVIDKGNNFRQRNLLSLTQLDYRLIKDSSSFIESTIDYNNVWSKLLPVINLSKDFLSF